MMHLSMTNFRGFSRQKAIPIKPITILVGENSAGKSSFLAALKYMLDLMAGGQTASFNSDPFQLGTFAQIAHFRGGRGGRAKAFEIEIRSDLQLKQPSSEGSENYPTTLKATFNNRDSQATLTSLRITYRRESIVVAQSTDDKTSASFVTAKGEQIALDTNALTFSAQIELHILWQYIVQTLHYQLQTGPHKSISDKLTKTQVKAVLRLANLAEEMLKKLSGYTHATSAIRMKPQRTYTPGTEIRDGEGSHVPFEIAKTYRDRSKKKEQWFDLRRDIEAFGKTSGMFKELTVKSFGQTVSDPFQLQFSSDGPKTNLIDLGYGTSQILPILHSISVSSHGSKFLIQQPEVHLHPRAQAALGQYLINAYVYGGKSFVLETHSDFIVDRVRTAVSEGTLNKDDVSILFFERGRLDNSITPIELNKFGEPIDAPENYRSFFIGEQMKTLGF